MAKNIAQSVYSDIIASGILSKIAENITSRVVVGTPEVIIKMVSESALGSYRM